MRHTVSQVNKTSRPTGIVEWEIIPPLTATDAVVITATTEAGITRHVIHIVNTRVEVDNHALRQMGMYCEVGAFSEGHYKT